MTTPSATPSHGDAPAARSRIGRRGVLYLLTLLAAAGVLGGAWLIYTAPDRRINGIVHNDPMATYVPPGANLKNELDLTSSRLSLSRRAKLIRNFTIPAGDGARVFQATARAARTAGWNLTDVTATSALGKHPETYATLYLSATDPQPGRQEFEITLERQR